MLHGRPFTISVWFFLSFRLDASPPNLHCQQDGHFKNRDFFLYKPHTLNLARYTDWIDLPKQIFIRQLNIFFLLRIINKKLQSTDFCSKQKLFDTYHTILSLECSMFQKIKRKIKKSQWYFFTILLHKMFNEINTSLSRYYIIYNIHFPHLSSFLNLLFHFTFHNNEYNIKNQLFFISS